MVKLTGAIDQLRTAHDGMCKMFGIEPSQQASRRRKRGLTCTPTCQLPWVF